MEWIKITEQKPPFGIGIMITNGNIVTCAEAEDCKYDVIYFHGHEFGGYEWEWDFDWKSITHWAELPKPPSVGNF